MASNAPPLPAWGSRLVRRLKTQGYSQKDIAAIIIGYSISTVKEVLRHFREHDEDRVPQKGKGKKDDPRWVFAGPSGPAALALLERVKEAGDDGDLLSEVHAKFLQAGCFAPEYRPCATRCASTLRTRRSVYASRSGCSLLSAGRLTVDAPARAQMSSRVRERNVTKSLHGGHTLVAAAAPPTSPLSAAAVASPRAAAAAHMSPPACCPRSSARRCRACRCRTLASRGRAHRPRAMSCTRASFTRARAVCPTYVCYLGCPTHVPRPHVRDMVRRTVHGLSPLVLFVQLSMKCRWTAGRRLACETPRTDALQSRARPRSPHERLHQPTWSRFAVRGDICSLYIKKNAVIRARSSRVSMYRKMPSRARPMNNTCLASHGAWAVAHATLHSYRQPGETDNACTCATRSRARSLRNDRRQCA